MNFICSTPVLHNFGANLLFEVCFGGAKKEVRTFVLGYFRGLQWKFALISLVFYGTIDNS